MLIGIRGLFELMHLGSAASNKVVLGLGIADAGILIAMHRFRHDLAPTYSIPFSKVRTLEGVDGRLLVHFVNGDHREDEVVIQAPPTAVELALEAFAASRR